MLFLFIYLFIYLLVCFGVNRESLISLENTDALQAVDILGRESGSIYEVSADWQAGWIDYNLHYSGTMRGSENPLMANSEFQGRPTSVAQQDNKINSSQQSQHTQPSARTVHHLSL